MTPSINHPDKVSLRTKLAFGVGDVGTAIIAGVLGFFRLIFMTDVAGLDPALAGLILLIGRFWDAINDPIIGTISDRLRTPWGRRRPMFLFGALPLSITFILMFVVPPFDANGKFWYYVIVSFFFDTFYTVVNTPYAALTPELSSDYNERTSLNSYRFAFSIAGSLIAVIGHQAITGAFAPDKANGYFFAAVVLGLLSGMPYILTFLGTYERPELHQQEKKMGFWEGIRATFSNRVFLIVVGIYLLSWLTLQSVQTILAYYLTYWLSRPNLQLPVILGVQISAFVWLFIWSRVSNRIGKKKTYAFGMIFWIVVSMALFFTPRNAPDLWVIVLGICAGAGIAIAYLIPWAMLPDVIENDELKTGIRREGVFYGYFALLQKFGIGIGSWLIGVMLSSAGYITPPTNITEPIAQPESVLTVIRLIIGPIPVIILIAGIYLASKFPITKEQHEETVAILNKRRLQNQN
jgi:GPH family glycoside/pentoside/hexuronide:cation symporter